MSSGICEPTVDDVRQIITTSLSDGVVQAMIDAAGLLVNRCITTLSCDVQAEIIKWVTAHLISNISSQTTEGAGIITSESLGDASTSYAKPTLGTAGLSTTMYGLTAMAFDPNGCLGTLGARKTIVEVLGCPPGGSRSRGGL